MFPTRDQLAVPLTQPDLGFPADVLNRFGLVVQSELEMPAHFGWLSIRPGAFNQGATGMGVTGLGNSPLSASLAPGVFRGHEAQKCHALSGGIKARQVAALSHGRYGHGKLDAAQGLEGCDHWGEAPGFALLLEFLGETLEAFGVFGHRADLFLQDNWLRRCQTDNLGEPPEGGRPPIGLAGVADIVAQPEGFETELGVLQIAESSFTRAREIA